LERRSRDDAEAVPRFEPLEPRLLLSDVGGHITTDTVWNNTAEPYRLTQPLFVDPGVTLTLAPGVTLRSDAYYNDLYVDGRLESTGATLELLST